MRALPACLAAVALLPAPTLAASRTYSVTSFDRIRVDGPYAVTLRVGPAPAARADGDMRAIDRLKVEVQGRTLLVRTDPSGSWGGWAGESPGKVALVVSTPVLASALLGGSGTLAIDRVKALRFEMAVSGSGSVTLGALDADRLALTLVGTGKVAVAGRAQQVKAIVQGSGAIDAGSLAVDDLDLAVSGSGDARFAAAKTAKVTATGSGEVVVTGAAACTVNAIGSGEVSCGKTQ